MALFGGNDTDITLKVSADTTDAQAKLGGLSSSFKTMTGAFVAGNVITGVLERGMHMLTSAIGDSIKSYEDSENALAQLNAALASTDHAAGLSSKQLIELSQSLQKTTTYSDEAVLSVENLLLTFTNITGSTFTAATGAVLDMATAMGMDAQNAALSLGKALNDPILGVSSLARQGVQFSDRQKEVIATMVKTGDTLGAQKLILEELGKEFGGRATAQAKTFQGQMMQLTNTIDDFQETVGHGATAALSNISVAFNQTTADMDKTADASKVVFQMFSFLTEAAANTATGLQAVASAFVGWGSYVAQTVDMLVDGPTKAARFWGDFRSSLADNVSTTATFAMNLHDANKKTLADWDSLTDAAEKVSTAGPKAYEATAAEAAAAKAKIDEVNKSILDTARGISDVLESYQQSSADNAKSQAEAYVAQQQKIKDLRKQRSDTEDPEERKALDKQIKKEKDALSDYKGYAKDNADAIAEATRRANETEFERTMEDIAAKQAADDKALAKTLADKATELAADTAKRDGLIGNALIAAAVTQAAAKSTTAVIQEEAAKQSSAWASVYHKSASSFASVVPSASMSSQYTGVYKPAAASTTVFNFNGTTVGDEGIKKLITSFIGTLDRSAALKTYAGT